MPVEWMEPLDSAVFLPRLLKMHIVGLLLFEAQLHLRQNKRDNSMELDILRVQYEAHVIPSIWKESEF